MESGVGMDGRPILAFESQAAWATWLAKEHASSSGVWIKFAKKGAGRPSINYAEAVEEALRFGWIDSQARAVDDASYIQRFTPRGPRSSWSKINCAKAEALIAAGRMEAAGKREVERAKADGRWEAAYAGPRTIEVPEDLQAELDKHPAARELFGKLNSQNRYAILYRIGDAKRPETRVARIRKFVDMLADGKTVYPQ